VSISNINKSVTYADLLYTQGTSSSSTFSNKLEKHLDDVKKGKSYLSKDVSFDLGVKDREINNILAETDINSRILYSSYSTAFSYDQRARFVNNTESTLSKLYTIKSLFA